MTSDELRALGLKKTAEYNEAWDIRPQYTEAEIHHKVEAMKAELLARIEELSGNYDLLVKREIRWMEIASESGKLAGAYKTERDHEKQRADELEKRVHELEAQLEAR